MSTRSAGTSNCAHVLSASRCIGLRIVKLGRLNDLTLIWLAHAKVTALTANINPHHISEAGGINRKRWDLRGTHNASLPRLAIRVQLLSNTCRGQRKYQSGRRERQLMLDSLSARSCSSLGQQLSQASSPLHTLVSGGSVF